MSSLLRWRTGPGLLGLVRPEHQRDAAAQHLGGPLDPGDLGKLGDNLIHDLIAQFHMHHLAAAKLHGKLDLVALFQELHGSIDLNLAVMIVYLGAKANLLEGNDMLFLLAFFRLALLLVDPLSIIHNPADRRLGRRRDLDEIQARLVGPVLGLLDGDDADLLIVLINQPYGADADLLIDSKALFLADCKSFLNNGFSFGPVSP